MILSEKEKEQAERNILLSNLGLHAAIARAWPIPREASPCEGFIVMAKFAETLQSSFMAAREGNEQASKNLLEGLLAISGLWALMGSGRKFSSGQDVIDCFVREHKEQLIELLKST